MFGSRKVYFLRELLSRLRYYGATGQSLKIESIQTCQYQYLPGECANGKTICYNVMHYRRKTRVSRQNSMLLPSVPNRSGPNLSDPNPLGPTPSSPEPGTSTQGMNVDSNIDLFNQWWSNTFHKPSFETNWCSITYKEGDKIGIGEIFRPHSPEIIIDGFAYIFSLLNIPKRVLSYQLEVL